MLFTSIKTELTGVKIYFQSSVHSAFPVDFILEVVLCGYSLIMEASSKIKELWC